MFPTQHIRDTVLYDKRSRPLGGSLFVWVWNDTWVVPYTLHHSRVRYRKVTTWPRVQGLLGANSVADTPEVTPFSTAHSMGV